MKTLLIIVLGAAIGFGAAYGIVSVQSNSRLQGARANYETEKSKLEAQLAEAQEKASRRRSSSDSQLPILSTSTAPARLTPEEILEKLVQIRPGSTTNRNQSIRLVIYYLESLAECGSSAVPVIGDFFAKNLDVDYTNTGNDENGDNQGGPGGQGGQGGLRALFGNLRRGGQVRTDFLLPPSLRLGLVDVLAQIGGEESEKVLATVLSTTGRGVEVLYVARTLETIAPGKYREVAIAAAKDLLANLPAVENPDRMDRNAKSYLYAVLEMYHDTSFIASAQNLLIGPDGRIDRDAMNYLNQTLKDQAVPALMAAYNNGSVTNQIDRAQLANQVLAYTGSNPQANALFKNIVTDTNIDGRMRNFAVMRLAGMNFGGGGPGGGGGGGFGAETPTDPNVIKERQKLIDELIQKAAADKTTDERLLRTMVATSENLTKLANGEPIDMNNRRNRQGGQQQGQPANTQQAPAQ